MARRRQRKSYKWRKKPVARINGKIRAKEVRVVDNEGEHLGVMPTKKAVELAEERELDLVEVSPDAKPPVAKIISFDKYRYRKEKEEQAKRKNTKKMEIKNIRISVRIGEHDMKTKARQANGFLESGKKVKVEMLLRGRERANVSYAFEQFKKFLGLITEPHEFDQQVKKAGWTILAVLKPSNSK